MGLEGKFVGKFWVSGHIYAGELLVCPLFGLFESY